MRITHMAITQRLLVACSLLLAMFVSGCLSHVWTGQRIYARVAVIVDEDLFERVRAGDEFELRKNPYRSQMILDGIKSGVTVQDVRESRFVFCHCLSSDSMWRQVPWFQVLLPRNSDVKFGDDVELVAGVGIPHGRGVTLSELIKRLPNKKETIPYCVPSDN